LIESKNNCGNDAEKVRFVLPYVRYLFSGLRKKKWLAKHEAFLTAEEITDEINLGDLDYIGNDSGMFNNIYFILLDEQSGSPLSSQDEENRSMFLNRSISSSRLTPSNRSTLLNQPTSSNRLTPLNQLASSNRSASLNRSGFVSRSTTVPLDRLVHSNRSTRSSQVALSDRSTPSNWTASWTSSTPSVRPTLQVQLASSGQSIPPIRSTISHQMPPSICTGSTISNRSTLPSQGRLSFDRLTPVSRSTVSTPSVDLSKVKT